MNIDLVYIWCDASEPSYRKRLETALAKERNLDINARSGARWLGNDELKYSLRSVEKFLPWVRRIFVITDGQTPKWLDTKNPRVKIVDHKKIIPKKCLPLFNSSAIELFIANIPDLSEHFIFANDDMFAGAHLSPEFFFNAKGDPIVDVRRLRLKHDIYTDLGFARALAGQRKLFERWLIRLNRLAFDISGRKFSLRSAHQMEAMRKSYLLSNIALADLADKVNRTRSQRFRDEFTLQRIIFPFIDNALSRNTLRLEERPPLWRRLLGLHRAHTLLVSSRIRARQVLKHKPKLFCINDDEYTSDKRRQENLRLLEKLFPNKSEFEKE
jgi:hypothetical protein